MKVTFFDTETTGLVQSYKRPDRDRVIELYMVQYEYDGKDFNDVDLRHSENVLVEYPFRHLIYFEPMKKCYFLSLKEAESTAEYLMELERKEKNEKGN